MNGECASCVVGDVVNRLPVITQIEGTLFCAPHAKRYAYEANGNSPIRDWLRLVRA